VHTIFDLEDLERWKREGGVERGAIFAAPHYGGFEWIAVVLGLAGFKCTVVTQGFKNPLLNTTFNSLREVSGHQTIRSQGAVLRLYKALLNQRSVTLAVDLTVSAKLPSVPIKCFGLDTCVTFAHAWLQKRTGAPIIPTYCEPLPGGRYKLVLREPLIFPPNATHHQIAQACWDCFEPGRAARSRAVAVDVQTLALPPRKCTAPVSGVCKRVAALSKAARAHRKGESCRRRSRALSSDQGASD
jgi:lauroyl/myristoyl acyltransferase